MLLRTVIVDDESSGRNILTMLLKKNCPQIDVVGTCSSVEEAVITINQTKPNLVFLDIEMPGKNGFSLLNFFDTIHFRVIFVTAYNRHAIRIIQLNALVYVLKPVRPEDLVQAVESVMKVTHKDNESLFSNFRNFKKSEKLAIQTPAGFSFADLTDIIRCESGVDSSQFILIFGMRITSNKTLAEFDQALVGPGFIRINSSHLINIKYIKKFVRGDGGFIIMQDGANIPMSIRKQEELFLLLNSSGK